MKIGMIEACEATDRGSIGAHYVAESARAEGHTVDFLRKPKSGYDVELVSLHHCTDFPRLVDLGEKKAPIRIVGGHPMANNPRPIIPFADVICIGEGESWIKAALRRLDVDLAPDALCDLPGTIISRGWENGSQIPAPNTEDPLPMNAPYLNRPGTRSAAWYIELARGCPYSCRFCELGHAVKHRNYPAEYLHSVIDNLDTKATRKINFYAPDEASHPDYFELMGHLESRGFAAGFSSMRIESVLRSPPPVKKNMLIRVGIDGLTEESRRAAGKPITDEMIRKYFQLFLDRGHVQFKMFMIVGYPWDKPEDFDSFCLSMQDVLRLPLRKNVSLRIKWTPFIPQPSTPLRNAIPTYDYEWMQRILAWHGTVRRPRHEPGIFVECDGLMSPKSHARQVALTMGDERFFF